PTSTSSNVPCVTVYANSSTTAAPSTAALPQPDCPSPRRHHTYKLSKASKDNALGMAAAALREAQEAVHSARRQLTAVVVSAYRAGQPVARIAERAGMSAMEVPNLLAATGTSRRG
ncbi:hypothetical protein, partial [Streptomyces sp. NPDC059003]|uniref:hypothetical protein n=1 Tax=Streptomyces sp. NPDC059003 TaxID=3346691 RepID=UPI0036A8E1D9